MVLDSKLIEKIERLDTKRKVATGQLGRLSEYIQSMPEDIQEVPLIELELRLESLESVFADFLKAQSSIEDINREEILSSTRGDFERMYFNLKAKLMVRINQITTRNGNNLDLTQVQRSETTFLKLPKIILPTFSGEYTNWMNFFETFNTLVHRNETLDDVSKFHYLRSSLKGPAFQRIQSLEVSARNYPIALKSIQDRYNNKKVISQEHIKALFNLPTVDKPSAFKLRELIDVTNSHLEALKTLERPTAQWDDLIVYLVLSKIDYSTRQKWEDATECPPDRLPTKDELFKFLDRKCHSLETSTHRNTNTQISTTSRPINKSYRGPQSSLQANTKKCGFCAKLNHTIHTCYQFLELTTPEKLREVKKHNLCLNCLRNHSSRDCTSTSECRHCKSKHHSLLHYNFESTMNDKSSDTQSTSQTSAASNQASLNSCIEASSQILLATAVVNIQDKYGQLQPFKALLDSGSQLHFVSQRCANQLGLQKQRARFSISGIGNCCINVSEMVSLTISSNSSSYKCTLNAQILPEVTNYQPALNFLEHTFPIPNNITLADPNFHDMQEISLLIGAELYYDLLLDGQIKLGPNLPILQNTQLGWVISGRSPSKLQHFNCHLSTTSTQKDERLENILQNFWELERHDQLSSNRTAEEEACESFFNDTTTRNQNGRYVVRLPFKISPLHLGKSIEKTKRQFLNIENKLQRSSTQQELYSHFMQEYLELNHMASINNHDLPSSHYFLPHHSVLKLDSTTTKLRVVFNGSAPTSNNLSLNDCLMVGPTIQRDLFSILIKFRTHRYAFTGDIAKMYRQILIHPHDRQYQCILWRNTPEDEIKIYQLLTVTYGTASAPFLATRCLQQLANDEGKNYPAAASILKEDLYVDDVMTGASTLEKAHDLQRELISLLNLGGFPLHKICANHERLMQPSSNQNVSININNDDTVKTLGLIWQPNLDCFCFKIKEFDTLTKLTKRSILSDLAKTFDPLGLLGPVMVLGKIYLQQLWKLKISWDDNLTHEYSQAWTKFRSELIELNSLKIPRKIIIDEHVLLELHTFADSSESAYGACSYLRSTNKSGEVHVQLICAKSRVAPTKTVTLPYLELCAALLAVELVQHFLPSLPSELLPSNIFYYTDSSIVLSWIYEPSYNWKTFVANRTSKIQSFSSAEQWFHIESTQNPADIISRGLSPRNFIDNAIWFSGPAFLTQHSKQSWPISKNITSSANVPDRKQTKIALTTTVTADLSYQINHRNSFLKFQRVIVYVRRIMYFILKRVPLTNAPITPSEMNEALLAIIKNIQRISFKQEFRLLLHKKELHSSNIQGLCPFIDKDGAIRVGGRLAHSKIPYHAKHQYLLPKRHAFTIMLVKYLHEEHCHAAPQTLCSITRQKFWPIGGKYIFKKVVNTCIRCFKAKPKFIDQLMGELPAERVTAGRPFLTTGIDFMGPVNIHYKIRGKQPSKAYVSVFVCFTTRAIHLELAGNLSSESFILTLKRFISRRGLCQSIFCDNATNFVGASNTLKELAELFSSENHSSLVKDFCLRNKITFKFSPPRSPHFGGLFEAAVKSTKYHLKRILSSAPLTYEELYTVLTQVEAVLNSRPISPISSDPNDIEALTPGHFIIGSALTTPPEPDFTNHKIVPQNRFKMLQQVYQHFWRRWHQDYLNSLQERKRWKTRSNNLSLNTLVLLKEEKVPPLNWPMGRVIKLYPGADGLVRVADVKTKSGIFKRPIVKLCPLPIDDE